MGKYRIFFSPLLLSACYALRFSQFKHLTSENNYISTNHFWIRLNYFQTDFCLYTAVPLYNLTQFGPVHIKQTWVRLTFKKKTKKTTHYIIPIIQAWLPPPTFQVFFLYSAGGCRRFHDESDVVWTQHEVLLKQMLGEELLLAPAAAH